MKIEWKRKLSSRKFILAAIALVAAILAFVGLSESEIAQITAIISAAIDVAAYIIGEATIDAARVKGNNDDPGN